MINVSILEWIQGGISSSFVICNWWPCHGLTTTSGNEHVSYSHRLWWPSTYSVATSHCYLVHNEMSEIHVVQGVLPDGSEVAVKQLSKKSSQGSDEFLNEVTLITGVQHRNLVKLRGCCFKGDERLLVYEFLENRSLHQALFGALLSQL